MADRLDVEVRGLDELNGAMRRFPEAVDRAMTPVEERAAQSVARRTRSAVPRRSGALASSVSSGGGEASMGDGLAYGGWIEYGGSRGRPYVPEGRYLGAAAQSAEEAFVADAARQTTATIGRFAWPKASL